MPLFFGFSSWFVLQLLLPCCWFQGVLLPKSFNQFMSERNICISMAASVLDVCRKNPDRGVDLILSVSVGICSNIYIFFSFIFIVWFCCVLIWFFPWGRGWAYCFELSNFSIESTGLHRERRSYNSSSWFSKPFPSLWGWCDWYAIMLCLQQSLLVFVS